MLQLPLGLALILLRALEARARTQFAPEDTYAFPKYHINFLNHHPITASRADDLLANGLRDGLKDFMGDYRSAYEGDWPTLDGPEDVSRHSNHFNPFVPHGTHWAASIPSRRFLPNPRFGIRLQNPT